jgi:hypothetical protein
MSITMCLSRECTADNKNSFGRPCIDPTVSHVGMVISTHERNGYDDSDFYAKVWDANKGSVVEVTYASTRSWTYHNSATVDATDDVLALVATLRAEQAAAHTALVAAAHAAMPTVGKMVRSTTTRGKNVGVTSEVRWYGVDQYHSNTWNTAYRVGVRVDGQSKLTFLSADKVEVI